MQTPCINCGNANLDFKKVQMTGDVRGETYSVEMMGLECPKCGYSTIQGTDMAELQRLLADKYRTQHGLLTSKQIRARRTHLGMTQEEFAQHLGVGIASVKRWEAGRIQDAASNRNIIERTSFAHGTVEVFCLVASDSTEQTFEYHPAATGTGFIVTDPGRNCLNIFNQYLESMMHEWAGEYRFDYQKGTWPSGSVLTDQHTHVPYYLLTDEKEFRARRDEGNQHYGERGHAGAPLRQLCKGVFQ